jgi:hypothetical protein
MACLPGSTTSAHGWSFAGGGGRRRQGRLLRGRRSRLGGRRFFRPLHHRGRLLPSQEGQAKGGAHKENGDYGGELGQERRGPGGAEDRLAGSAKSRPDAGALAVLQEHDGDQGQGHDDMNDNDDGSHNNFII